MPAASFFTLRAAAVWTIEAPLWSLNTFSSDTVAHSDAIDPAFPLRMAMLLMCLDTFTSEAAHGAALVTQQHVGSF